MDFPSGSGSKESACNAGDLGSNPGLGRSPGREYGNPLQYCLENPMDSGAWRTTVHGVAKSQVWLSTHEYREENNCSCFYPPLGPNRRPQNYKHKEINVQGLSIHKPILPGGTWWFNDFTVMYYSKREREFSLGENIPNELKCICSPHHCVLPFP